MKRTLVSYSAKPERADENQCLIEQVFAELRQKSPQDVRYLVLRLDDGRFVHFSAADASPSPITRLDAFRVFQSGVKERCLVPPQSGEPTVVGNYRMLDEGCRE